MGLSRFFVLTGMVLGLLGFVLVVRDQVGFSVRVAAALAKVLPGSPSSVLGLGPAPRVTTIGYMTDRRAHV